MSSQPNVAERFKQNVIGLASNFKAINNSAIEKGYNLVKRELTVFLEAYLSRMDGRDLLRYFAEYSYMYWDEISHRDTVFFNEHAEHIFDFSGYTGTEFGDVAGQPRNVVMFRQLLTSDDAVTDEDRDLFWRYFEAMVRICWKAILEDEVSSDGTNDWIPSEVRDTILNIEDIDDIIQRIMDRRTQK